MSARNPLVIACVCAVAAWMPVANAQLHGRQETRSGVLEFEANGYPTDATVERVREEIDYQRAVQAYIHSCPRSPSCSGATLTWARSVASRAT